MVPQTYMKDPAYWTLHSSRHQRDSESSFYSIITYLKAENEVQQKPLGTLGATLHCQPNSSRNSAGVGRSPNGVSPNNWGHDFFYPLFGLF